MEYTMTTTAAFGTVTVIIPHQENDAPYQWGDFLPTPETLALSSSVPQRNRITTDPNILGGEPYIQGTRIPITVILDGLAEGLTPEELIEHYPRLRIEDIRSAQEYAATTVFRSVK